MSTEPTWLHLTPMTTEATWLHLSIAHGFAEWTYGDLADQYPSFVRPGWGGEAARVDVAGLHARDHQEHHQDLDHDHQEEP